MTRLDRLAVELAQPMPRSRLLRLAGAVALGAIVPAGLRPAMAGAGVRENCAAKRDRPAECACANPNGSGLNFQTCCWHKAACMCSPIAATCCSAGTVRDGPSKEDPGSGCVPACIPKGGPSSGQVQKYDPKTQCCTPVGVMHKTDPDKFSARQCKDQNGNSTLTPRPGYKPTTNGCGSEDFDVPDTFTFTARIGGRTREASVNFKTTCNAHDRCYGTCGAEKEKCDKAFRRNLRKKCTSAFSGKDRFTTAFREECLDQAALYGAGVMFADSEYWAAQAEACHCC